MSTTKLPNDDSGRMWMWWGTFEKGMPPDRELLRILLGHHFNRRVSVFLPGVESGGLLPPEPSKGVFYYAVRTPLATFMKKEFIDLYIRQGKLAVLAKRASLERGCAAGITPTGVLHMSLDKDGRESLGLDASPSKIREMQQSRYRVQVDLLSLSRGLGKRLLWCLDPKRIPDVEFLVQWTSPRSEEEVDGFGRVFPLEEVNWKTRVADHKVILQKCPRVVERFRRLRVPPMNKLVEEEDGATILTGFVDWIGAVFARCWVGAGGLVPEQSQREKEVQAEKERERYWAFVEDPLPYLIPGGGQSCSWSGFVPCDHVVRCVASVQSAVEKGSVPWGAVCVWGFDNAPVSIGNGQHECGENDFVVLITPGRWHVAVLQTKADTFS